MKIEERLHAMFVFYRHHRTLVFWIGLILSILLKFLFAPLDTIVISDSYLYVAKALELTKGNWTPLLSHPLGYPIILSWVLLATGTTGVFHAMVVSRVLDAVIAGMIFIPTYLLAREILDEDGVVLLILILPFDHVLIRMANVSGTEPLFIFLIAWMGYFLVRSQRNILWMYPAIAIGAVAYYIRFNGIFLLAICLAYFLWVKRRTIAEWKTVRHLILFVILFFLIYSPILLLRSHEFGNPFYHAAGSRLFLDNVEEAGAANIANVGLIGYVTSHTLGQNFKRFVIDGFINVVAHFTYYTLHPILMLFAILGLFLYRRKEFMIVYIPFLVWVVGFSPVFAVAQDHRHMVPLHPFFFILALYTMVQILRQLQWRYCVQTLMVVVIIGSSLQFAYAEREHQILSNPHHDKQPWGVWAQENLNGNLVLPWGTNEIMMYNDSAIIRHIGTRQIVKTDSLTIHHAGVYDTLTEALIDFHALGMDYLGVNEIEGIRKRQYLREVYSPEYRDCLTKVYGYEDAPLSSIGMEFFRFEWESCKVIKSASNEN